MIRLIQRRLIIPRGDTGSFSIPVLKNSTDNIAVFTIFDEVTHTKMFQKLVKSEGDVINIAFTHNDTVNLKPGKYVWDIKYYSNPEFVDEELVNGEEIDSYYAGFSLPVCEIRETADNYLVSPDAPSATLSPSQLDIITSAINGLNEAIRKTNENVEHYPEIRDEVWYVWDAEQGDYVSTDVRANGIVGNGIESAVLNNDYTLTLNFTDGTSFTSSSIRGETGNGIDDIVLNNDFTLTISYTDGESYTTPSIRGPVGATPQFSIGTVQDGAVAAASITGTAENPVLNLTLPNANVPTKVSELENDAGYLTDVQVNDVSVMNVQGVANVPMANSNAYGVVKIDGRGLGINPSGVLVLGRPTDDQIKAGDAARIAIDPAKQHQSTFYGLAKAAGDTTQSQSSNAVGTYTEEAKAAIQQMLDVPSTSDIPTQVSELTNDAGYLTAETDPTVPAWAKAAQKPSYTAAEVGAPTVAEMNTAIGTAIGQINSFDMAVVQTLPTQNISTHTIYLVPKTGETNDVYDEYVYINSNWEMVGNTQIDLSNYALKSELPTKVSDLNNDSGYLTSYTETDPTVPQWAKASTKPSYTAAEVGALPSDTHIPSTTAELTNDAGFITVEEVPEVPVQDVQVDGTSILVDGVANVPVATESKLGVVRADPNFGTGIYSKRMIVARAPDDFIKNGANSYRAIVPITQHLSTFYGLAKAAGDTTQSQSSNTVGNYTDNAKEKIQSMLGITQMLAPTNPNLVATQAYSIGDVFAANGHLYKATAAIAQDEAIIPDTNCVETTMVDAGGKIKDVQVGDFSVVTNGIAKINVGGGLRLGNNAAHAIMINEANAGMIRNKSTDCVITPSTQHIAVFYGLASLAGDTTQALIAGNIGTYTEEAKTAIKEMLGVQDGLKVVRLI